MNNKSFQPRLINIPMLFVLCLFLGFPVPAQQNSNSRKSVSDLFEAFKTAKKLPCGERAEAIRVGQEIIEKFSNDELNKEVIDYVKSQIPVIEQQDKECKDEYSLENLFKGFKDADKNPCGQRGEALTIGKKLLELYSEDKINRDVIYYVKKETERIEKEDSICQQNTLFNESYKNRRWSDLFTVGKQIIQREGDKPLALDVMLTLVAVGFHLTAYEKDDAYTVETVSYAMKALDLIEGGTNTSGCWGVFECYKSKEKALGWLNYTIGYISYFRLKGDKKAIPYFYKSTKYKMEFKYDAFVYQAVAIYYFDKEPGMTSSLDINSFVTKAQNLVLSPAENTYYTDDETAQNNEFVTLYKKLLYLYSLRYNLEETEDPADLANYIQLLINKPLIDTSANNKQKPDTRRIYKTQ
jgi:hypothetical protein